MAQFGSQAMTPASGLGAYMVTPKDGASQLHRLAYRWVAWYSVCRLCRSPLNKLAEHGGRGKADQDIMIVMEGPGVQPGFTTNNHVWIMQIGSTVAAEALYDLANATLSPLPGTSADNFNCHN